MSAALQVEAEAEALTIKLPAEEVDMDASASGERDALGEIVGWFLGPDDEDAEGREGGNEEQEEVVVTVDGGSLRSKKRVTPEYTGGSGGWAVRHECTLAR